MGPVPEPHGGRGTVVTRVVARALAEAAVSTRPNTADACAYRSCDLGRAIHRRRMSLEAWTKAGWLRAHGTQAGEVRHLAAVAAGDLVSAADPRHAAALRFEYAYNAALKACLIALYAERRRPGRVSDVHHRIIRSLPLTLGPDLEVAADYLDACRDRRDRLERPEEAAKITDDDANALRETAGDLLASVDTWLRARHPDLMEA